MVARSAMTLKLMTYAPTGGLVAAPTAGAARAGGRRAELGLPVHLDRDGSFSIYALLGLGFIDEAEAFGHLAARPRRRACGRRRRPAEDHVPGRRLLRPDRGDPRPLRGLARLAHRCGSATAPPTSSSSTSTARRWTRISLADKSGVPVAHQNWLGSPASSTGCASTGTSPTRASGRPAAAGRTSSTAGSRPGWRSTGPSGWRRRTGRPADLTRWTTERDASTTRS